MIKAISTIAQILANDEMVFVLKRLGRTFRRHTTL